MAGHMTKVLNMVTTTAMTVTTIPALTISAMVILPEVKTIRFGGVPTGIK